MYKYDKYIHVCVRGTRIGDIIIPRGCNEGYQEQKKPYKDRQIEREIDRKIDMQIEG